MHFFKWHALDHTGQECIGTMYASDSLDIELRLASEHKSVLKTKKLFRPLWLARPLATEAILEHLKSLITSGYHLDKALHILSQNIGHDVTAAYLSSCAWHLQEGSSFTDIAQQIPLFPYSMAQILSAAEKAGCLDQIIPRVIEHQKNKKALVAHLRTILFIPVCTFALFVTGFIALFIFIKPQMDTLSASLNSAQKSAPAAMPSIFREFLPFLVVITIGLTILAFVRFIRTRRQHGLNHVPWSMRTFSSLSDYRAAQFFKLLALLLAARTHLNDALTLCTDTFPHLALHLKNVEYSVAHGETLSAAIEQHSPFHKKTTKKILPFVHIGEATSTCEHTFLSCAQHLEHESFTKIHRLMRILQPLLFIGLGCCVLALIVSFYIPLLRMGENMYV